MDHLEQVFRLTYSHPTKTRGIKSRMDGYVLILYALQVESMGILAAQLNSLHNTVYVPPAS